MLIAGGRCAAAWLLALATAGAAAQEAPVPAPPGESIVLVVIDTLRRDHLASYGYERRTSPLIDHLVAEGTAFDGVAPASWTKPSVASILTGLHPIRHQTFDRVDRLPSGIKTLAERLHERGYFTLGLSANPWVGPQTNLDRGFQEFALVTRADGRWPDAAELNRAVLSRLDSLRPPFFLYVQYVDPHPPYEPRAGWDGKPLPASLARQGGLSVAALDASRVYPRDPAFLTRARDLYDGEIRQADDALGQLLAQLRQRRLLERAVVVVASDHGEEFGEHGRMSHGQSLYREVVDVPLVFWAPGRIRAQRGGRASLLDVTPTLTEVAGAVAGAGEFDGISLVPQLFGRRAASAERPLLLHLDFVDGTALAMDDGHHKLVLGRDPYRKQAFDLDTDPLEQRSVLAASAPAWFARLARDVAAGYDALRAAAYPRATLTLADEAVRGLAAVGYFGAATGGAPARRIPAVIRSADGVARGLLGWEGSRLASCIDTAVAETSLQLLDGWYGREKGGRWSSPRATFALPVTVAVPVDLQFLGVSYRGDTARLRASVNGRVIGEAAVPPGEMRVRFRLPDVNAGGQLLVELQVDPPFVPAEHGAKDARSLGLFVSSICLRDGR